MLCCGILTLAAAAVLAASRWFRAVPRAVLAAAVLILAGAPAVALSTDWRVSNVDRDDVIAQAMTALCGAP